MRFLADESVSRLVVARLRTGGFEVMSIAEAKPGASDTYVLKAAASADRILITEDRDFGELVIRQRLSVGRIVLLELDRLSSDTEARAVAEVVSAHSDKLPGNLAVVEPGRIRVRPLRR